MASDKGDKYTPPKSTRASATNTELRHQAHRQLDRLADLMEAEEGHGSVGVELTFERGRIVMVRRTVNGTERSSV